MKGTKIAEMNIINKSIVKYLDNYVIGSCKFIF